VRRREQGGAAVEVVVVAPLLIFMVFFVVGLGRLGTAREAVDGAARDAAREASIARNTVDAQSTAKDIVMQTLAEKKVSCANPKPDVQFSPDPSRLTAGGTVKVVIDCTVQNDDVGAWGLPGTRTMHGEFTAVVDTYRGVE
jgi:Flp pilus assembly protein TadG